MQTIFFKVFIEFVTILLVFYDYVYVFDPEACQISASRSKIEISSPVLEGKVSTTAPPGKSPDSYFLTANSLCFLQFTYCSTIQI